MPEEVPKIIINDGFVDLRLTNLSGKLNPSNKSSVNKWEPKRTPSSVCLPADGVQYNKELINFGLKKLVVSYHNTNSPRLSPRGNKTASKSKLRPNPFKQRLRQKPAYDPRFRRCVALPSGDKKGLSSHSDVSMNTNKFLITPNLPLVYADCVTPLQLHEPIETRTVKQISHHRRESPRKSRKLKLPAVKDKDKEPVETLVPYRSGTAKQTEEADKDEGYFNVNTQGYWRDPRLLQKYSVLKVPWRRTWTLPVFTPKSMVLNKLSRSDNFDRQTYLYDDGTEVDSNVMLHVRKLRSKYADQMHYKPLLYMAAGMVFGILLVSFIIWLAFGNNIFLLIFKPRESQDGKLKKFLKYMAGGLIHIVSTVIGKIYRVFTMHTYEVIKQN